MPHITADGYYFVKPSENSEWVILLFRDGSYWNGKEIAETPFYDIDERPIIHYTSLPAVSDVKRGMTYERHLLENYYVALPPLPMPNATTVERVTVNKTGNVGMSSAVISDKIKELEEGMAFLRQHGQPNGKLYRFIIDGEYYDTDNLTPEQAETLTKKMNL